MVWMYVCACVRAYVRALLAFKSVNICSRAVTKMVRVTRHATKMMRGERQATKLVHGKRHATNVVRGKRQGRSHIFVIIALSYSLLNVILVTYRSVFCEFNKQIVYCQQFVNVFPILSTWFPLHEKGVN